MICKFEKLMKVRNFHKSIVVMKLALLYENIRISVNSIRSNTLRTVLTILIIAFGIMALVGILTAIDSIKGSINKEFTRMGANTFSIESRGLNVQIGAKRTRTKNYTYIDFFQAKSFKERFDFPATVSISVFATGTATVKYEAEKTNPNVRVMGVDENFIITSGHEIAKGRNFTAQDLENGSSYVIIGHSIAKTLFKTTDPIDKIITIGSGKYRVIGVLKEKGSSMGFDDDKMCVLPYSNVRQYFSRPQMNYRLSILPLNRTLVEIAQSEAEGLFRTVRGLAASDESDFNITRSDNLAQMLIENLSTVTAAATIIGFITLLGAAIGLMNIMLVSVAERTREIGTRKAIGATAKIIKQQFLFESIIIGQLGGICGIILGIAMGNLVSLLIGSDFIIPWVWIITGVVLCFIVGVLSGLLPAIKASKLDPIAALRHE